MLSTDAKMQKIKPNPNYFMMEKSLEAVYKRELTQREVVFIF